MRHTHHMTAMGIAATILMTALASGPAASAQSDDNRQKDKNTMRSVGIGLGAAAVLQALQGKGTGALLLGAGAAYAGKRYEDDRKQQQQDQQAREDRENQDRRYRVRQEDKQSGSATSNSMPGDARPIDVFVNHERVHFSDQKPEMTAGSVYIPMRGVLEKIGADVRWSEQEHAVYAQEGSKTVRLPQNGDATINGRSMKLDTPAYVQDGRTMVPLRFLAQTFGATVKWDESNHAVYIDQDRDRVSMAR
jgi:hypothetical protein